MRIPVLNELGLYYGNPDEGRPTTFTDEGRGASEGPHNPMREAHAHVLSTIAGYLAGSMRLARHGHLAHSLMGHLGDKSLLEHLLRVIASDMVVMFGDSDSALHIHNVLAAAHRRQELIEPAESLPEWLVRTNGRKSYSPADRRFRRAIMLALRGTVAKAHYRCGLIGPNRGNEYCRQLSLTVGWASQLEQTMPTEPRHLLAAGRTYEGIALMDASALEESGMAQQLHDLFATELLPGTTVGDFWPYIGGFMYEEDLEVIGSLLGKIWTNEDGAHHNDWCDKYFAHRVQTTIDQEVGSANPDEFFDVALRRGTISALNNPTSS